MSEARAAVICVVIIGVLFGALIGTTAAIRLSTERSLAACRDRGGFVEYFDALHADNWRCVGVTP